MPSYSKAFKAKVVAEVQSGAESRREIAKRFGIAYGSVHQWVTRAEMRAKAQPRILVKPKAVNLESEDAPAPVLPALVEKPPEALSLFEAVQRVYSTLEPMSSTDRARVMKAANLLLGMLEEEAQPSVRVV